MKFPNLFPKLLSTQNDVLFSEIIGYDHIKRPFNMTLRSDSAIHILLVGPPETGIVSETKYGKTKSAQMKTSVFATSNNLKKLSGPLNSRFVIVELDPYTYEQFCEITTQLLSCQSGVANLIANAVWNKSQDIRDCVRIGTMAKSIDDVRFLVDSFWHSGF